MEATEGRGGETGMKLRPRGGMGDGILAAVGHLRECLKYLMLPPLEGK